MRQAWPALLAYKVLPVSKVSPAPGCKVLRAYRAPLVRAVGHRAPQAYKVQLVLKDQPALQVLKVRPELERKVRRAYKARPVRVVLALPVSKAFRARQAYKELQVLRAPQAYKV